MSKIKKIVLSAMLLAITIILSRFISIKTEILVINLAFIPTIMSGIWLGWKYSTLIAVLADIIGAILFPFGAYFPGFTLNSALAGLIYGLLLYNNGNKLDNKQLIIRLIIANILVLFGVNLLLSSFWIHILYGKAYIAVMASRIVAETVKLPIQIITIYILEKFSRPFVNKYLLDK